MFSVLGELIAHLPIDIRLAKLVIFGYLFDVLEDCIIIAAGLSSKSIFAFPFDKKLKAYANKLQWSNQVRNYLFNFWYRVSHIEMVETKVRILTGLFRHPCDHIIICCNIQFLMKNSDT